MGRYLSKNCFKKTGGILTGIVQLNDGAPLYKVGEQGQFIVYDEYEEEITVPVGQGAAGVWGVTSLGPSRSIILGVVTRITQAPGGGACSVDVGRAANPDEFVDGGTVGLGDEAFSPVDGDGVNAGPVHNASSCVFKVTTDVNVTVSDMKIRVAVFYLKLSAPDY